jgi:endonuclease/exonuclease/phosphatase (EEP) superfamily protein YafD
VSVWGEVALGVIAVASLVTAIGQIILLVAAARLFRRASHLTEHVERELTPLFGHMNAIGREAARAASLATAQVERADAVLTDAARRVESAVGSVQQTLTAPSREGRAILEGFRAAIDVLRQPRATRGRGDEEDALFI